MPIDAPANDLDALRALVSQLTSERDAAIAQSRRLTEQNNQLRHLLKRKRFNDHTGRPDRLNEWSRSSREARSGLVGPGPRQ
jgi:uncharacterized coiled-coil DUF342 family protein